MSDPKPGTDRTNPKDLVGQSKVDLSLFPPAAHIHGAHAFMDGARKYGAYNWRERQVRALVYISAAQRHLADFLDGEDLAQDSGVHHLGHVIACCGIILDALETGNLIDDRPVTGAASAILDRINAGILARQEARKVVASTPNAVVTAGADVRADKIAAIVEAHIRRTVSDEVEPFPTSTDGDPLDLVRGRRDVTAGTVRVDHVDEVPGARHFRFTVERDEAVSIATIPLDAAADLGRFLIGQAEAPSLVGPADCGCAPGVRCHSTFKPSCPRLVEGRDTGKLGCREASTKAPAAVGAFHPGRIGYGE